MHSSIEEKPDFSEGIFLMLDIHLYNYFLDSAFPPSCSPAPNWWLQNERYFLLKDVFYCTTENLLGEMLSSTMRGAWAWWAFCLCPSSVLSVSLLCGATGTEDSRIWLCRVGHARQGRRPLCCSGRERTFIMSSSQCSAQDFVQWHLGAASWAGRGGSVPGIIQEEVKSIKTRKTIPFWQRRASAVQVPCWARCRKQKPGRGKHRSEFGKRILILALSSRSNSHAEDGATEVREHCLQGRNNTKKLLTIPNES